MSEQPPDPSNNPNYLFELTMYAKRKETEMLRAKHSEYKALQAIIAKMRDGLGNHLVEKIRDEETQKIPPAVRDKQLIEIGVEARIASLLAPFAKRILENGRIGFKQNPTTEYNDIGRTKEFLRQENETLDEMVGARDQARFSCATTNCLLDPHGLTNLSSTAKSFNAKIPQLRQLGVQLDFFPVMPMDQKGRHEWIEQLLEDLIFTNEQIATQRQKIHEALYNIEHAVTFR